MNRRPALLATALAFVYALAPSAVQAQIPPTEGVTIVVPLNAIGPSRAASVAAMQSVVAVVRKQPGLIEEALLANKNPANAPSHVHVMRWREQKNWETLFASPEFRKVLGASASAIALVDSAGIYTPVSQDQPR